MVEIRWKFTQVQNSFEQTNEKDHRQMKIADWLVMIFLLTLPLLSFEQDGRCSRKKGLVLKDNKLIFLPAGDKTIIGS